ncbi:MAG: FIST C-terminal domain-containing protein, partial [Acidobacteria bacterium]|nr:FIST C-terminal domain-containing protein [Acidobacteriota bacterium]
LLFATSKHDPQALRDGIRSVIGPDARLTGGSAVGVITNDRLGYEGHQVGVAVLASPELRVDLFVAREIKDREYDAGRELGERIAAAGLFDPNLILMYDLVKSQVEEGISLNMATPLLAGLTDALEGSWPPTAGGGLMGDSQFRDSFQLNEDFIEHQSAIALALAGGIRMDTIICHGCKPASSYFTITRADGNVVLELDGRRAVDVVAQWMGSDSDERAWEDYPLYITLGMNHGEKFGCYQEDDYAVRLCMDVDRERGGLAFFGDDLQTGKEVQLMRRSIDFSYIGQRVRSLMSRLDDRRPVLALYIDCIGRAGAHGIEGEEASEVQRIVGERVPMIGWYVGCEIAQAGASMQSHNWTGVLSVLSE